jgi:hypothetical protein
MDGLKDVVLMRLEEDGQHNSTPKEVQVFVGVSRYSNQIDSDFWQGKCPSTAFVR